MHPFRLTASLALLLAPALPAAAQGMMQAPPPPLPAGSRAPAFSSRTLTGRPLSLAALRGRVVLLDYWATWCGPCRMATPTLQSLHRQFGRRGLSVVGISVDDPGADAQIKAYVKAYGVTYPIAASPRANFLAAQAYHAHAIPSQYLIDRKGVVRWSQAGYSLDEGRRLPVLIRALLAEK